jgi:predicted DNA-binding transcriptional regulator AlpA
LKNPNLLTASAVAKMAGVSRVTVWKAASSREIPGTSRTPGGQFRFTRKGAEEWATKIKELRRDKKRRRALIRRARFLEHEANTGVATVHAFRMDFDIWYRRCPVESWPPEVKRMILEELRAPAELALRLAKDLDVTLG